MSNNRYSIDLPYNHTTQDDLKLIYIASSHYDNDWNSIVHSHHCSEVFYVLDGIGQFQIEDQLYTVQANDLIVVNPNVLHTELSLDANPFTYIVLGIEGLELLPDPTGHRHTNFYISNFMNSREKILFYLNQMLEESELKDGGYEIIVHNLLGILIQFLNRQPNFSSALIPVRKKTSRLCHTIRKYIDNHYKENLTLERLAQVVHTSKFHISHLYTEEYGISPINYMIEKRIHEACDLLTTGDYALSQISDMLGFSSQSYFSQAFKKQIGCSPNQYRQNSKQAKNT